MKILTKLSIFSAIMLVLLLVLGAIGQYGITKSQESLRTMYEDRVVAADQLATVGSLLLTNRALLADAVHSAKPTQVPALLAPVEANLASIRSTWKAYDATFMDADERAKANEFARQHARYLEEGFLPTRKALLEGQSEAARALYEQAVAPAMVDLSARLQQLSGLQSTVARGLYEEAQARDAVITPLFLSSIVLGAVLAACFSYALARNLVRQLGAEPDEVLAVVKTVAAGDLSAPIAVGRADAHSVMAGLVAMQKSLSDIVGSVRAGSESVASASAQIAAGNHDLSARTEQQAAALQQTAAAMTQLGVSVSQNAQAAKDASTLASDASQVAVKGGAVVAEAVQRMRGIHEASRKISEITSVIDGIAFQTNILALNAAVEAARAGEQGRGFAVVATEVRNLASRSASAAKEIKDLIQSSVERVGEGSALVEQAGDTMREVVDSIERVAGFISTISDANVEAASGVSQAGSAVVLMDSGVQQNAALVEEMAAAASALKSQAGQLVQRVSEFKLGNLALAADLHPALLVGAGRVRSPFSKGLPPDGHERRKQPQKLAAA